MKGLEEPFPEPDKEMLLANLAYFAGDSDRHTRATHQTGKLHRMLSSRIGHQQQHPHQYHHPSQY
jgi:hypothetical protein